ncbi:MAG: cupin domain-containing protein [Roseimicrobium sp.]
MSSIPSDLIYSQRPPSAAETFQRLVAQTSEQLVPRDRQLIATEVLEDLKTLQRSPEALPTRALEMADAVDPVAQSPGEGEMQFRDIYTSPENQVFKVVFFPDRIFHAQYLNATRAPERYRYAVTDARSVLDISVLKAQVFLDGRKLANLVRIEYRASRLIELTRESGRLLREEIIAWVKVHGKTFVRDAGGRVLDEAGNVHDPAGAIPPKMVDAAAERPVKMHFCPWINAYQVEIWETLAVPGGNHHFQVQAQMGPAGSITRVKSFAPVLQNLEKLHSVEMAFRENDVDLPSGTPITDPKWDNNYERNFQSPKSPFPSDNAQNTVPVGNYFVTFRKGWYLDARKIAPVRYRNGMMDPTNPEYVNAGTFPALNNPDAWKGDVPTQAFRDANVIEMRWILQREFGGSVVFFHEVTIPPGTIEGTHCHVGSEELYYIIEGEGVAYMAAGDDPETMKVDPATGLPAFNLVQRHIYGLFPRQCVELPVSPGKVIFTKSGGVHGIRNTGEAPLKFVAFLYNSV